jgi:hypothetical protein
MFHVKHGLARTPLRLRLRACAGGASTNVLFHVKHCRHRPPLPRALIGTRLGRSNMLRSVSITLFRDYPVFRSHVVDAMFHVKRRRGWSVLATHIRPPVAATQQTSPGGGSILETQGPDPPSTGRTTDGRADAPPHRTGVSRETPRSQPRIVVEGRGSVARRNTDLSPAPRQSSRSFLRTENAAGAPQKAHFRVAESDSKRASVPCRCAPAPSRVRESRPQQCFRLDFAYCCSARDLSGAVVGCIPPDPLRQPGDAGQPPEAPMPDESALRLSLDSGAPCFT